MRHAIIPHISVIAFISYMSPRCLLRQPPLKRNKSRFLLVVAVSRYEPSLSSCSRDRHCAKSENSNTYNREKTHKKCIKQGSGGERFPTALRVTWLNRRAALLLALRIGQFSDTMPFVNSWSTLLSFHSRNRGERGTILGVCIKRSKCGW